MHMIRCGPIGIPGGENLAPNLCPLVYICVKFLIHEFRAGGPEGKTLNSVNEEYGDNCSSVILARDKK